MRINIVIALIICCFSGIRAQLPKVCAGTLHRHQNFSSKYVASRNIDVWLPEGYTANKKYNVLYMQDGQMIYDKDNSWNKVSWEVDDAVTSLIKTSSIQDVIIIGVWNSNLSRHADYMPQKPFETLSPEQKQMIYASVRQNGSSVFNNFKIHSDDYLKFLVEELKPFIDRTYSTFKDRKHTFLMGSSMGGLISIYAICEYPQTFGGAACLSTHWPGIFTLKDNPIPEAMIGYLKNHLPDPKKHKIYFDYGTATLDTMYAPIQKQADVLMKARGFNSKNWTTRECTGEDHSEKAWGKRVHIPLVFLLGKS